MTIVEQLKAKSLELRKARNPIAASITFALSEVEKVGKNAGNRETSEDEAIRVIQKLIATIDSNIAVATDDGRKVAFSFEKNILESVLPQLVSPEIVRSEMIAQFGSDETRSKGAMMKWAKAKWGSLVDMKQVGSIMNEIWGL